MSQSQKQSINLSFLYQAFRAKLADYKVLVKFGLNMTVVFSATFGYMMALGTHFDWVSLLWLALGGFLVTSSANAINQIIEKEYDKLMKRTADRPLASGRMDLPEAVLVAGVSGILGLIILAYCFNPLTALLGAISLIAYAFVYTPLKRVSPIAVFVGAIPGALPVLIGYIAALGPAGFNTMACVLFGIQFLWQFPHFWAIGWLGYDDYKNAGFKLLTTKTDGRNKKTAVEIAFYIVALIAVSVVPTILGVTGWATLLAVGILGGYFFYTALQLIVKCDNPAALKVMFASLFFLPITQIVMVLDKIF